MIPEVIGGRFRRLNEIGRGGMGVVYRVLELGEEREVALKVLLSTRYSETALRHFEQEFRTLTSLSHPHLTEVYDFGRVVSDDGAAVPYFTMELVEGKSLDRYFGGREIDWARVLEVLAQVGHALAYLHSRGLVHRDVKPSNILVLDRDGGCHAKLMDLGLAGGTRDRRDEPAVRGTVAYLAPEAVRGDPPDPRTDLYALGCTLYEIVSGRPPFLGETPTEIIRAHLTEEPLPLTSFRSDVPAPLADLVARLLKKDPGNRPATADRFLEALQSAAGGTLALRTAETRRHRVLGAGFVGREEELSRLERLLAEAHDRGAPLALLLGAAGSGKSRLLREFEIRCQLRGMEIQVARPEGPGGSTAALGGALARAVRTGPPLGEAAAGEIGETIERLLGRAEDASYEGAPLASRVVAAVAAIASARPIVLALEDLHDADETTCVALRQLLRACGPGAVSPLPVLVVGTCRGEELSRSSPVFDLLASGREERLVEEIDVGPLRHDDAASLLRSMLGLEEVPQTFVERALEETRGNPLHLSELLAALAEEGHVQPGSGVAPDPSILDHGALPGRVRDLLGRRVARIEPEPLRVLRAGSVLGRVVVDPDAVAAVTGMRWDVVLRHVRDLAAAGILRREDEDDGTPVYRVALPGLVDLVAESIPAEESGELHARALSYLERRGVPRRPDAWRALARHAEGASKSGRAAEAWARAGDLAREAHAPTEAVLAYGRAIELGLRQGEGSAVLLCGLYERRGEVHLRAGDTGAAEEDARWMLARAEKAGAPALRARAHLALGRALAARGDGDGAGAGAAEHLTLACSLAEEAGEREIAAVSAIALGSVLGRSGEVDEALARLRLGMDLARALGRTDLEAEALVAEGTLHRKQGNFRKSLSAFEEAVARAGTRPPATLEGAILEGAALAHEVSGRLSEAVERYEIALSRATTRGDVPAAAALARRLGVVHLRTGDVDAAKARFDEAFDLFRRIGSREGTVETLLDLAALHSLLEREDAAVEAAEEGLRIARRTGRRDLHAAALGRLASLHVRHGDLERAAPLVEEATVAARELRHPSLLASVLSDGGERARLLGRSADARTLLQEAAFHARQGGDRRLEAAALLRLGYAWLDDRDADRALVACRRGLQLAEQAGLAREEAEGRSLRARIELIRPGGDVVRAETDAEDAKGRFEALGDREGSAVASFLLGKALKRLGRPDAAADPLEGAARWIDGALARRPSAAHESFLADPRRREIVEESARLGREAPRDAVEPSAALEIAGLRAENATLRRLLETSRLLATTRDPEALLRAILDAALELTGAERGFLLLADGEELETRTARGTERTDLAKEETALSRSIARRVLDEGRPFVASDTSADGEVSALESVIDLRIRSVLCVPLRSAERVTGAIYLDSRIDRGALGRGHLDAVERLAEQAAVTLETARLLDRIEEQRGELERVNRELERTAEAQRSELADAREALVSTRSSLELRLRFEGMVGGAPAMQRVYHLVERLAPKRLPVLVLGESGTGKELIARALHARSDRSGGPFLTVNCAALPENLLESELFGYRKGAFTGADRNKPGLFQLAHGGTLFLDEIGEMGAAMQAKLLRVLQEGEVFPVGGNEPVRVDVRIVSATNRDLQAMVRDGRFREDLYYRIHVARIELPPLRTRKDDIPLLASHFLEEVAREEEGERREFEPEALRRLSEHPWPGNVRELQHVVHRLSAFARGSVLTARDLERYGELDATAVEGPSSEEGTGPVASLEETERRQIALALAEAEGNRTRAAEILGINRATLFRKIRKFGIET